MALNFLQSAVSGSDLSTYTFSSQNLGTASADRYIIASVTGRAVGTPTLSGVTIGGVTATSVVNQVNTAGGNTSLAALFIAAVPTGTTGDVVASMSGSFLRCGIGLWAATNLDSATATDSSGSTANDPTYAIDVSADGFAIGCAYNADTATASWTNLTEDFDEAVEGAGSRHSGASATFASAQTNLTLTCDWSTSLNAAGAFASWKFAAPAVGSNLLLLGVG